MDEKNAGSVNKIKTLKHQNIQKVIIFSTKDLILNSKTLIQDLCSWLGG
jgi:hypothetical protein